jgi:hypothetical protein
VTWDNRSLRGERPLTVEQRGSGRPVLAFPFQASRFQILNSKFWILAPGFRLLASHVRNDVITEFGALDLSCSLHKASEIVGDSFAGNCSIEASNDAVRRFSPAQVA